MKYRTGLTCGWHWAKVAALRTLHSRTARIRMCHCRWHNGSWPAGTAGLALEPPAADFFRLFETKVVDGLGGPANWLGCAWWWWSLEGSILELHDLGPPTFQEAPNCSTLVANCPDRMRRSSRRRPLKLPHKPHSRLLKAGGTVTSRKLSPSQSNLTPVVFQSETRTKRETF